MPGNQFDLRTRPVWMQYAIALTVTTIVVAAAWAVGRHRPPPGWIIHYLAPVLGWAYIVLFIRVMMRRFRNRRR